MTFQEHAPANKATDHAEVIAVDAVITIDRREYRDVLQFFEASTSEPDLREFKYFALGIGLIRAENICRRRRTRQKWFWTCSAERHRGSGFCPGA